ncbi:MAG: transcription antitermination factor NusB [bacterium]
MGRRIAREQALKAFYQMDVARATPEEAFHTVTEGLALKEENKGSLQELIWGMWEKREKIDELIDRFAVDWTVERLSRVDRAVLRLAVYELLYCPDIPASVSINEAVELCKKYSGPQSGPFVNGILGAINRLLKEQTPEDE